MNAVLIKLLNMSIAAGWLALAVIILRFALKKSPKWVACVLWAMVALRLVMPFSLQSSVSVIPSVNTVSVLTEQPEDPSSPEASALPEISAEEPDEQGTLPAEISFPQSETSFEEISFAEESRVIAEPVSYAEYEPVSYVEYEPVSYVEYEPVSYAEYEPVSREERVSSQAETSAAPILPGTVDHGDDHGGEGPSSGAKTRIVIQSGIAALDNNLAASSENAAISAEKAESLLTVLSWVWAAGCALMLGYALFSYLRLRLRVRSAKRDGDAYICDTVDTPFILGVFRPRIYIPAGMDEKTRFYVISHEKAHVKRLDHIWKVLGYAVLSVYWFAPLVWISYILFCRDIELACDEKTVKTFEKADKAGYSRALLDLNRPRRIVSACPLAFGEIGVKERVKKVLSYKKPVLWIVIASLLICFVLCACMMTDPKDTSSAAEESEDSSRPDDGSEESKDISGESSDEEQYVREEYKDYRVTFFTDPAYPGVQLCRPCSQTGTYPMFSVEEEIYTGAWGGGTGLIFKGKWYGAAESSGDGVYGFAFDGSVKMLGDSKFAPPFVDGGLIFVGGGSDSMVYAPCPGGIKTLWLYETVYTNENSNYLILYNGRSFGKLNKPYWSVMDREGNVRSLPVADEYRWYVTSLAFDPSSDDPDAVTVMYLEGDTEKTVAADLGSTRVLEDTEGYYCKRTYVPGNDIEIPDFLSKPFKELNAHPVPGTLNIYTCDEFEGRKAIFQTDGTGNARIDDCFVFDYEYTDPASDYALRVYAGRRFMNNGDGTYRAKTAYAVVGDLSDSPQYFEEEPVVYGKLVIVEYKTEYHGENAVTARRVFAPGLENDPVNKYYDKVYTREGSDYILVNYSYYFERMANRPYWFVFDKSGTAYSLPVPAQYRWNVNSISFDTSSDDPDDVIAKYVLDDDTVTTVKANLRDMRPFTDLSAYYCNAPESSKHVLVLDPVEGSDLFYTCDEYPGKNIINGINSQTSFVFVVDEELFSLTGPDGTKATVFSGTEVHYGSGDLIEKESCALVCGDTKTVVRTELPQKLGDNLFYCPSKDDGFIKHGTMYFIMDSRLMGLSCFGEPGVREGVDVVFFTEDYPDAGEFAEWTVIGRDGVLRSLPELDGKRYIIKDIAFDPAYSEGGRVRVAAYRWNTDLLGYEEFSYGADLASCRAVGLEYYGLGIDDLYGNYTFKNVYPEVSASSLPTKAGFFELDAFPGYMLMRTKENRVIKFSKQFDGTVKLERNGREYEARGYYADIYGISNGKLIYLELGSAVFCGDRVLTWGYGATVKYHNLFVSSEFDEADGVLYRLSDSGKMIATGYRDLIYGRETGFCMVRIEEKDEYDNLIIDWQGCTYSLEGDGKPFRADEIKYDEEKGMIAYTESSQQTYSGEYKFIAFEDLHRDDATNYDLISVDESGKKPSFPGKKIIYAGVDGEYPFYVVDKELFTLDWDGKTATGFEGRFVEYAGGKVKTSWCFGVACGDKVCRFNHKGASLYAKGKLAIYEDKERSTGYVLTGCGETFEKYRFETISLRDGADCVILNDITKAERRIYPVSMIIGLDGMVRSLPVSDDVRWRLIRMEFNYASDDPGDVAVYWYKYFNLHESANAFPSYRIGNPFSANIKDTVPVEYDGYYIPDPVGYSEDG